MRKRNKIILFSTIFTLVAAGTTFSLCRDGSFEFANYISSYPESIVEDDFLVSAHRGFSSLEVENTKQAIDLAASKKYIDYIEVDARMTKDGKIVLSHNNGLYVSSDILINVSDLSYEDVLNTNFIYYAFPLRNLYWFDIENGMIVDRNVKLNSKIYQLVGLKEALNSCKDKKVLLDLKFNNDVIQFCNELKDELKDVDTSNIVFQSLNIPGIKYLQEHSDYTCLALISKSTELSYINDFNYIGLQYDLANEDLIRRLISSGKKVAIWTINNSSVLQNVIDELGDYYKEVIYITDYPDLIVTKLHEKEKSLIKRY